MKAALLDVNVLIALLWPAHQHHRQAHRWFRSRGTARWATCPLTELAFVRIVANPAFSPDALPATQALALLERNIGHPTHEFWPDDLPVPSAMIAAAAHMKGHQQITDAYLVALAARRGAVLASFDEGIKQLAPEGRGSALEIVPTS